MSAHGITLARQSLDESSSAYLSYDRVISAIEEHRSLKNWSYIMKLLSHTRTAPGSHARTAPGSHARDAPGLHYLDHMHEGSLDHMHNSDPYHMHETRTLDHMHEMPLDHACTRGY